MNGNSKITRLAVIWALGLSLTSGFIWSQDEPLENDELIRIGLLVEESTDEEARSGAERAVREINQSGKLQGRRIELLVRSMEGPWGKGSKQAVELIFDKGAWALIGASQGRNAHLVEQVIAKTSTVFISSWAADPTLSKAYVPHFFNLVPNSEQQAEAILQDLTSFRGLSKWILAGDNTYDSEKAMEAFHSRDRFGVNPPVAQFECNTSDDFEKIHQEIRSSEAEALVLLCEPEVSWNLIRFIRSRSLELPVYGLLHMIDRSSPGKGSESIDSNVYLASYGAWSENSDIKKQEDQRAPGQKDTGILSAYVYDAVYVLAKAIVESGFDPEKLQEAVFRTDCSGQTGAIGFDQYGNRRGIPELMSADRRTLSASRP